MTHLNGVRLATVKDRFDSPFSAATRNIAAIDFGTANCSIAYCTTDDEEMTTLNLSTQQENQLRIPTILLVNEDGRPIKFGALAIRHYERIDQTQKMKYHLFERIKLALGPNKVCVECVCVYVCVHV